MVKHPLAASRLLSENTLPVIEANHVWLVAVTSRNLLDMTSLIELDECLHRLNPKQYREVPLFVSAAGRKTAETWTL